MPTIQQTRDYLVDSFFNNPDSFSLVTGIGIGRLPDGDYAPQILIFVEPVADCQLQVLWEQIHHCVKGERFLLLRTGRFAGLQAAIGSSISARARRRFNVPPESAGTAGLIVEARNRKYLIGSNHVIAFNGRVPSGASVVRPGTLDQPRGGLVIGTRSHFVPLQAPVFRPWTRPTPALPNQPNLVDCALAELTPAGLNSLGPLQSIQVFDGAVTSPIRVKKNGRTTSLTRSTVCIWDANIYIDLSFGTYYFGNLMGTVGVLPGPPRQDTFAAPGDSGAAILTDQTNEGLGLVIARAYCAGVFNPSPPALGPPPAPGAFVGYIVLLCSLKSARDELAAPPLLGISPDQIEFSSDIY